MIHTEVRWSMREAEDPYSPIVEDFCTSLSGFWAGLEGTGEDTASEVAARWFEEEPASWGDREVADVLVVITAPVAAVGSYDVTLMRVIKGSARKVKADDRLR